MAEIELKRRVKYAGDVHSELLKAGWDCCTAAEFLNNIPDAADVAPVRHGRWVLDEKRYVVYCSECSEPVSYYPNIRDVREENHYCPNCGCLMKEGDD